MPRVSIYGTNKTFEVTENEIIYNALSDRGEDLPHGCLAGSCGACRIEILEGKENLLPAGIIETNTVDALKKEFAAQRGSEFVENKTIRLSCRAKVKDDIVIRPID